NFWRPRWMNVVQGYWFSFFYGLPTISWLVIHNRSHHGNGNQPGLDVTSTHNVGDRNDLVGLLLYTPMSFVPFLRAHARALRQIRERNGTRFWFYLSHV